jgi:hypothetical protein
MCPVRSVTYVSGRSQLVVLIALMVLCSSDFLGDRGNGSRA